MSKKAMHDDLARSGLDAKDVKKLGLKNDKEKRKKILGKDTSSEYYRIPYFDINGKKTDFYRDRILTNFKKNDKGKEIRYSQPKKSTCRLYFPPLFPSSFDFRWKDIADNINIPIIITEGEKKAAAGCKAGAPTIGLGGVWSFQSKKKGVWLLPDFDQIKWRGRVVKVIYDSDLAANDQVLKAMRSLSKKLCDKGAKISTGCIPLPPEDKAGIDDYLLIHTVKELQNIELESDELGMKLFQLNEEIAYIENLGKFHRFETGVEMSRDIFLKSSVYATWLYTTMEGVGERARFVKRSIADYWLKWGNRRIHTRSTYVPGGDKVTDKNELNAWIGWGCEPKKGSVKPFMDLIDYVFKNDSDLKKYFLMWLACPIQNPGAKLYTSFLVWSPTQGTGKSLLGVIVSLVYGENAILIESEDLTGDFNACLINKQFACADEIINSGTRKSVDKLKNVITRDKMLAHKKGRDKYQIDDCVNYYLTSNHSDALFLDPNDRRFIVHKIDSEPESDEFYSKIHDWKENAKGASALFHYLKNEVDCSSFNPKAPAMQTKAKENMQYQSYSRLEHFLFDIKEDPDTHWMHDNIPMSEITTPEILLDKFDPDNRSHLKKTHIEAALEKLGFLQCTSYPSKHLTGDKSRVCRFWAMRNLNKWKNKKPKDWYKEFTGSDVGVSQDEKTIRNRSAKFKSSGKVVNIKDKQ